MKPSHARIPRATVTRIADCAGAHEGDHMRAFALAALLATTAVTAASANPVLMISIDGCGRSM
jgi:hypothetical protein